MATAVATPSMDPNVSAFVTTKRKLFINGKFVDAASGKTFPTYNPATGDVLANIAEGDREDINRAVKAARAAFETGPWSKMSPAVRGRLIWKLADLIEKHGEEFAQLESLDNGKPLTIARVADVPLAVEHLPLLRRLGHENRRQHHSTHARAAVQVSRLHRARARGRGRSDHSLEFSAADGGMEARPGAGRRLHRGSEASRTNSAHRAAARRIDSGSGHSRTASSTSSPATAKQPAPRLPRIQMSTKSRSPARPKSAS